MNAENTRTRRSFLKTSASLTVISAIPALTTSTETAPGGVPSAVHPDSTRKVRIGVIGGNFGLQFQWHEHPGCTVQAVSDLRPERRDALARTYKCENTYPSLEELIKDRDVDAVAIFTPAPDHVRHVTAAMKAGKHVICAVPAAFTLDECHALHDVVKETGLIYMNAETSYYRQPTISARKFFQQGRFGRLFCTEAEYFHPGLDSLWFEGNQRTWRYGFPPMHYPTHCTAFLVGVTGERLTSVSCNGWGDDSPMLKDNVYNNPFWSASAFFRTGRGNSMRVHVWWRAAVRGAERATWFGDKMSFYSHNENGAGPIIERAGGQTEKDDAGFARKLPEFEQYQQPQWWKTDLLPEALRHDSGHDGSHCFLTHEFIDAVQKSRRPTIDVHEALAYVAPGIVAHESALKGGQQMPIPSFDA